MILAIAAASCRGLPLARELPVPESSSELQPPAQQLVFHTDFQLSNDHRLVRELLAERDDVATTLGLPPSEEEIHVHLFRDADAYRNFLAQHYPGAPARRAIFIETDTQLNVCAHWSDVVAEDLRHEVAHGYLHASVPAIPLWLDEGLAEYFEVPRGHNGLNRPHLNLLADLAEHNGWRPNIERLEKLTSTNDMQQSDYAEAWAWAYFLLKSTAERRKLLVDYLAELRDEGAIGPLSARLKTHQVDPHSALTDYLVTLRPYETRRRVRRS
jgi:hypothetical protein